MLAVMLTVLFTNRQHADQKAHRFRRRKGGSVAIKSTLLPGATFGGGRIRGGREVGARGDAPWKLQVDLGDSQSDLVR
jgi:hypothetical protein